MKQLSIQFQTAPRKLTQTRRAVVRSMREMNPDLIVWSDAGYGYININLETEDPAAFWVSLNAKLNLTKVKTIVTCQGNKGWDDFLLLHHFDKRQKLGILV